MEIKKDGETLDLGQEFSIQIEDTNPAFNDIGSQSVPVSIPVTKRNARLLGGVQHAFANTDPNQPGQSVDVIDGSYFRRGSLNITEAGRKAGFTFNIGFNNSKAYENWSTRTLKDVCNYKYIRPRSDRASRVFSSIYAGNKEYDENGKLIDDIAIFPVALAKEQDGDDTYWEFLNMVKPKSLVQNQYDHFYSITDVNRNIDGERTIVSVPEAYAISPFIKVWRVLELVFNDLGLEIIENPFKLDRDLERLVVLNNTADACCLKDFVYYRDLMPDCTIKEFMNSLWVRFGLVYDINFNDMTVSLKLMKNILKEANGMTLDALVTDFPLIRYLNPQYIKLSAGTSIEGAQPVTERFEDFIKGLDTSFIKMGPVVADWQLIQEQDWDREVFDGFAEWEDRIDFDDPDWPDPDDWDWENPDWYDDDYDYRDDDRDDYDDRDNGRDDDRDYDYYSVRSKAQATSNEPYDPNREEDAQLAYEFITGQWYKLDNINGKVKETSSSFFNWDPQTEGCDVFELSSADECVPVLKEAITDAGHTYMQDYLPMYLVGSRHFHSYVVESDKSSDADSTPLAFMFAYQTSNGTIGRLCPDTEEGQRIVLADGTKPEYSLFFQFKEGLFAKFWKEFDEILRHGNREIEVPVRMSKVQLNAFEIARGCLLNGLRCMPDKLTYSLPSPSDVDVDMVLRSIQPMGEYDIDKEQNIPPFSSTKVLSWYLLWRSDLRTMADQMKAQAAEQALQTVGSPETGWQINAHSTFLTGIEYDSVNPWNDTTLGKPTYQGQRRSKSGYIAYFHYDVYEEKEQLPGVFISKDTPFAGITLQVKFDAIFVARWFDE